MNGIKICKKKCKRDEHLAGQLLIRQEGLNVTAMVNSVMLEEDVMHLGRKRVVTAHVLDPNRMKKCLKGVLDRETVLSVMPIETWSVLRVNKRYLFGSKVRQRAGTKEPSTFREPN